MDETVKLFLSISTLAALLGCHVPLPPLVLGQLLGFLIIIGLSIFSVDINVAVTSFPKLPCSLDSWLYPRRMPYGLEVIPSTIGMKKYSGNVGARLVDFGIVFVKRILARKDRF